VIDEAIHLLEGRDKQVDNLLRGMEELNGEIENVTSERDGLRVELEECKAESGKDVLGGGGELSLAEREELIRLRVGCIMWSLYFVVVGSW
jgi:hypothetical protein